MSAIRPPYRPNIHRVPDQVGQIGTSGQTGAALIYIIVSMVVLAALGAGMVSMYGSAQTQASMPDNAKRAQFMAESGLGYARAKILAAGTDTTVLNTALTELNTTASYAVTGGGSFALQTDLYPVSSFVVTTVNSSTSVTLSPFVGTANAVPQAAISTAAAASDHLYLVNEANLSNAHSSKVDQISTFTLSSGSYRATTATSMTNSVNNKLYLAIPVVATGPTYNATLGMWQVQVGNSASFLSTKGGYVTVNNVACRYDSMVPTGANSRYYLNFLASPGPVTSGTDFVLVDTTTTGNFSGTPTMAGTTGSGTMAVTKSLSGLLAYQKTAPVAGPSQGTFIIENVAGVTVPGSVVVSVNSGSVNDYTAGISFDPNLTGSSNVGSNFSGAVGQFGTGARFYFTFNITTDSSADGFVFAIKNAALNTTSDCGGPRDGVSHGDFIGYAGPGLDDPAWGSRMGIRPPKFGIEFDLYTNGAYNYSCPNDLRNDPNNAHMAYVYWGENPDITFANSDICPGYTEDDNVHGIGGANTAADPDPMNPASGSTGFYSFPSRSGGLNSLSLVGGQHAVRVEVERATSPVASGTRAGMYQYDLRTWYNCTNEPSCSDITVDYPSRLSSGNMVYMTNTIYLTAAQHTNFDTFIYGYHTATGASTGTVSLSYPKVGLR